MPQMAPMLWLNLMIMLSLIILTINTLNFFNKKIEPIKTKIKFLKNSWKW